MTIDCLTADEIQTEAALLAASIHGGKGRVTVLISSDSPSMVSIGIYPNGHYGGEWVRGMTLKSAFAAANARISEMPGARLADAKRRFAEAQAEIALFGEEFVPCEP